MKRPAPYWTYQAPPTPKLSDLPPGTFGGDTDAWESLSPGMRREIARQAQRRERSRERQ